MNERQLIVNADDFGLSPGVNRSIITAHEHGIVTSASLMVRGPSATAAADYACTHPRLAVGLHVDLGEWAFRDGDWVEVYRVAPINDAEAVTAEIGRQLDAFRALMGRHPTHLDSHQHVHRKEPIRRTLLNLGQRLGVPVRHCTPGVAYCGEFYGQDAEGRSYPELISAAALVAVVERVAPGITELACHPGEGDLPHTMYNAERRQETLVLCDPLVRSAIVACGVDLITFADIRERIA